MNVGQYLSYGPHAPVPSQSRPGREAYRVILKDDVFETEHARAGERRPGGRSKGLHEEV